MARKRASLVDTVRHLTQGRRGLAIVYKDIEKDFEGIDGVETGHFGAVEGIDRWGNVAVAVIIGRPMPKAQDIERMAAAITGRPVVATSERCEREVCGTTIKCWTYTDPDAERVRAATVEAAVEQAGAGSGPSTGRRPIRSRCTWSCTTWWCPACRSMRWSNSEALEPGAVDEMVCRGLVPQWPSDASDYSRIYSPTPAAAKKTYHRGGLGRQRWTSSYKDTVIRKCRPVDPSSPPPGPPRTSVRYQRQGARQRPWLAWVDPVKVPDIRARLEARVGELDLFECWTAR